MGITVKYHATSLEEIAQHFDGRAEEAERLSGNCKTERNKSLLAKEADVWHRAADLLRKTTLNATPTLSAQQDAGE